MISMPWDGDNPNLEIHKKLDMAVMNNSIEDARGGHDWVDSEMNMEYNDVMLILQLETGMAQKKSYLFYMQASKSRDAFEAHYWVDFKICLQANTE